MTLNLSVVEQPGHGHRRAEEILGYPVKPYRWTVEQAVIPPGAARELLDAQPEQRPVRSGHVRDLAAELTSGRWDPDTPEPVCFDENGHLLEGQHRLMACVQAGVALRVDVKFNIPRKAFVVINRGRARNLGDDLVTDGRVEGMWSANTVASAARILRHWDQGYSPASNLPPERGMARMAHADTVAVIAAHPLLPSTVEWFAKTRAASTIRVPGSAFCAMLTLFREVDDTLATCFGEQVLVGENIAGGDPAFELRKALTTGTSRSRDARAGLMFRMVRAWNALREGRRIFKLYAVSVHGLSFPEISGAKARPKRVRGKGLVESLDA